MHRLARRPNQARSSSLRVLAVAGALLVAGTACARTSTVDPRDLADPPTCLVTGTNPPRSSATTPSENCPDLTPPPAPRPGTTTTPRSGSSRPRSAKTPPTTTSATTSINLPSTTQVQPARLAEKAALERNRERWTSTHPASYRYTWSKGCLCPQSVRGPFVVTVRGADVQVEPKTAGAEEPTSAGPPSIDDAFATATRALGQADEVTISYDPAFGFPSSIAIGGVNNSVDAGESVTISDFSTAI